MSNGSTTGEQIQQKILSRAVTAYRETYNSLCKETGNNFLSMVGGILVFVAVAGIGVLAGLFIWLTTVLGLPVATQVIEQYAVLRKGGSQQLNELIAAAMGEYLGVVVSPDDLPIDSGPDTVLDRARKLGFKYHNLLRREFILPEKGFDPDGKTHLFPDSTPAETFSGYAIDFAVFTALTGLIGEIASLGKFEQFKELGANMTVNLSLGRMQRVAQMPLFKIGVAEPMQWALNRQLRPTLLKEQELVAALHSGDVSAEDVYEEFARLGYSVPKINTLISQYKQRVSVSGVDRLWRWGILSRGDAVIYLTKQGWAKEDAELALRNEELARMDVQEKADLDLLRRHVVNGVLTEDQTKLALEAFHIADEEKLDWLRRALFERDLPRKFLTEARLMTAFEEGIIDVDQFDAENRRAGYSTDDQSILLLETLLALKKQKEAAAVKAARAAKPKKPPPPPKPPKP